MDEEDGVVNRRTNKKHMKKKNDNRFLMHAESVEDIDM